MATRKARTSKAIPGGTVVRKTQDVSNVPPGLHVTDEELIGMSDENLRTLRDRIRHEMRVGHPEYPFYYWKALCDLDVKLHLEAVNRRSYGTKIKRLKYS